MFTGIIECLGKVISIQQKGTNRIFHIESKISPELSIDQSLCHNGVCLTIESIQNSVHVVSAVQETIEVSNLSNLKVGDLINLERCVRADARMDGHFVQGHVDDIGLVQNIQDKNGSWLITFNYHTRHAPLLVSKGSVSVNGVSLTVINPTLRTFQVAIIPYTYNHTVFHLTKLNDPVNLEFDIIGKYLLRKMDVMEVTGN